MGLRNSNSESFLELTIEVGTESTKVRVYDEGPESGLALFVLHGWGSSSALMQPLTSRLRTHWRTIAIDMPGHGASAPPPSGWGIPEHVAIVESVARSLKVEACAIVGHSNGGRIAMTIASNPQSGIKPAFLVLISPSGIPRSRTTSYYIRLWTAKALKFPFSLLPPSMKSFGLDWLRNSLVWKMLGSSDFRSLDGVMKETFVKTVNHYVLDVLPSISCPVLVFWGSKDDSISKQQMETLVSRVPDAGFFELDNAGHFGYMDRPETVVASIQALVEGGAK